MPAAAEGIVLDEARSKPGDSTGEAGARLAVIESHMTGYVSAGTHRTCRVVALALNRPLMTSSAARENLQVAILHLAAKSSPT